MNQRLKKGISILLSVLMMIYVSPKPADALVSNVITWFSGEKSAEKWTTAITINSPDTDLLSPEYMIELEWEGIAAPNLALSSWSGGKPWVQIPPCENIDGNLYYSYSDMAAGFGEDMSLVDSLYITACATDITVYSLSVVPTEDVLNAKKDIEPERRVVGYLPDWSYSTYKTMNWRNLTHINIAFCNPDIDGNLSCNIPDLQLKDIVSSAHKNGVKVLASLGGAGTTANYTELTGTAEKRTAFNKKIMEYCTKYNLDGIDLDIESGIDEKFWTTYESWCLSLREICNQNDLLLTTATACWLSNKATNRALQCFDYINVMAYDNDTDASTHSSYEFAEYSLNYFRIQRSIPNNRLVLGVPFYGRGYNEDGTLSWTSYVKFSQLIQKDPENYNRDVYEGVAYNGADTIKRKCDLASQYGGIMIWELSQDAADEFSLLDVIGKNILKPQTQKGDINLDEKTDITDLILLKQYLFGTVTLTDAQKTQADINQDNVVNILDLCWIKEILLQSQNT